MDYDYIWTLELIQEKGDITPIFNAICLHRGQWELEPSAIRLFRGQEEYKVAKFSVDSGDTSEPFLTPYLGMKGPDSVGVDLVGEFKGLETLTQVVIEIGKDRFILQALNCDDYNANMDKIAELDMQRGNMVDDFESLGLKLFGQREAK